MAKTSIFPIWIVNTNELTLYLLVLSVDNFANSLDKDQVGQNFGPDLDSNCLALWGCSWKNFSKMLPLKKKSPGNKRHEK